VSTVVLSAPIFDHLDHLTDERGLFEHAHYSTPRREHGYCVDDVAHGLVVVCRQPISTAVLLRLEACYLDFVLEAITPDGSCHNRMNAAGDWTDRAALGDWWGRALWGLGAATSRATSGRMRERALAGFRLAAGQRSRHLRAMVFAALGAAEILGTQPNEPCARTILAETISRIGAVGQDPSWLWPEPRLTYSNGALAEALILAGAALRDAPALARGLLMLSFLMRVESRDGHLSVTPVGGRGPGEVGPSFDQQPIEVAALADACATAYRITHDPRWLLGIRRSWDWFEGLNDSQTRMFDPATGAGYDGLERDGCNLNQGAESTLAMLSTAQHAQRLKALR